MTIDSIRSLQPALAALLERFRHCFKRGESFGHWQQYVTGLIMQLKRKSIEPIALATGVPVRTLQEFLAFFAWDHERVEETLRVIVAEEHASDGAIGVVDASAHSKSGEKTPGVQRQWCGESGKIDNCVIGQHLLYTNNDPQNPFSCVLASDLFLPEAWSEDRDRCRVAGIPDDVVHRAKWQIAIDQIETAMRDGIHFRWMTVHTCRALVARDVEQRLRQIRQGRCAFQQAIGLACPDGRIGHLLDVRLMQQPTLRLGYVLG